MDLSASEDTDHISQKRRIEAYRLSRGDGQGEKEAKGENIRIGGHVKPTHTEGDLILRLYNDRQAVISSYYLRIEMYILCEDVFFVASALLLAQRIN